MTAWLEGLGSTTTLVDIRHTTGCLYLKSGMSCIGKPESIENNGSISNSSRRSDNGNTVVIDALVDHHAFKDYNIISVTSHKEVAKCSVLWLNNRLIMHKGAPILQSKLAEHGYTGIITVDVSERVRKNGRRHLMSIPDVLRRRVELQ